MDMREREMRERDGRNPYGSRGGYVVSSRGRGRGGRGRGRRGDRGMYMPEMPYRSDYGYEPEMRHGDYAYNDMRGSDYGDIRMRDGHHYSEHHPMGMGGQTYYPIEAMGRFNGYWGMPQEDYGANYRYGGGMGGRMDYGYDYGEEKLSHHELEEWNHKLLNQLDERERQMFSKDAIMQRLKQHSGGMEGYGEEELYTATLMVYTDYKNTIGQNVDMAIKLAKDWLNDKDVAVRGAEKLAVYYDCIVEGE